MYYAFPTPNLLWILKDFEHQILRKKLFISILNVIIEKHYLLGNVSIKGRQGCLGPNVQELSLQTIQIKGNHIKIAQILTMKSLWLSFWGNFKILHFDAFWTCTFLRIWKTYKEYYWYPNRTWEQIPQYSFMERKTAVNTLGGWYVGHCGLLLEKRDIFNKMKSNKVFKQMEQDNFKQYKLCLDGLTELMSIWLLFTSCWL